MIGSLLSLAKSLNDDELAALIELAISATNGAPSYELAHMAERLATLSHERKIRRGE